MFRRLLENHVLANLTFVLVLVIGLLAYTSMPRQQDPTINFNWIIITTVLPGASALDVEKKVTDPMEDAIRKLQDVKFMSSNSRESVSSILVRFEDIDTYDVIPVKERKLLIMVGSNKISQYDYQDERDVMLLSEIGID